MRLTPPKPSAATFSRSSARAPAPSPFVPAGELGPPDAIGIKAPALSFRAPSFRLRLGRAGGGRCLALADRAREIRTRQRGDPLAELVAQGPRLDLHDGAGSKFAELERTERQTDQPVDLEAEVTEHVLDLAVLAFPHRKGEPDVAALRAVERRLDRTVADAVNADAGAQPV